MKLSLSLVFIFTIAISFGKTIYIGHGQQFTTIQQAASIAQPGDKLIVMNGIYTQRENISNLNGKFGNPIIIHAQEEGKVIYRGQSEAWHLSSCSNLFIYGFIFENQTSNGVNIDDSGNYDNSTFNIIIKNCVFRDINASGNNDLLKLSGLEDFTIENCIFQNGADGGSGIDMVGCHSGLFYKNKFENMGSNCIQVKGGSQYITIKRNTFIDGGRRSLNLGGNTGLEYFRPHNAPFEAADINVYSNIFIRSWAPIAFVGSTRVKVYNNTFYKPENWVFRILQETVDTSRFIACGDNEFSNNIIYFGNSLHRILNTGPDTRPETFVIDNNLWYNFENPEFDSFNLPVTENNSIKGKDPLFINQNNLNFDLSQNSPAIAKAKQNLSPELDFKLRYFADSPSIGAFEYNGISKDFTSEPGTTWYYHFSYPGDYQTINIITKVIKDNKEVSIIDNNAYSYDFSGNIMKLNLFTTDGITYIGRIDDIERDFEILYDYNLKTNDTLFSTSYYCSNPFKSLIDSVRFEFMAGKVRKILYTSPVSINAGDNCKYYFGQPGKLVEGIHSVNSFMLGSEYLDNNYTDSLRCYSYTNNKGIRYTTHFLDPPCDTIIVGTEDLPYFSIEIYPNPVKNKINIDFDDNFTGTIEIFDISGKLLLSQHQKSSSYYHFDISTFPKGTYFLKIRNKIGVYTNKFVKI